MSHILSSFFCGAIFSLLSIASVSAMSQDQCAEVSGLFALCDLAPEYVHERGKNPDFHRWNNVGNEVAIIARLAPAGISAPLTDPKLGNQLERLRQRSGRVKQTKYSERTIFGHPTIIEQKEIHIQPICCGVQVVHSFSAYVDFSSEVGMISVTGFGSEPVDIVKSEFDLALSSYRPIRSP